MQLNSKYTDAVWRAEFDATQLTNCAKIPMAKWNNADYYEVLTKSYPEFGSGGASQFVTQSQIKLKRLVNLKTGETKPLNNISMKRWKLLDIIINYIYHDNIYLVSPVVDWELMNILNKQFKENYQKIRPVLLEWEKKGYISLVENSEVILVFHPEKLPSKEQLIKESS